MDGCKSGGMDQMNGKIRRRKITEIKMRQKPALCSHHAILLFQ
jgi:hypothetical protein